MTKRRWLGLLPLIQGNPKGKSARTTGGTAAVTPETKKAA